MTRTLALAGLAVGATLVGRTAPPSDGFGAPPEPTQFALHIENVSTAATLKLSNGETAPAPTAPVLWLVHTGADHLFTDGKPDRGEGLESLAEEGDPSRLAAALEKHPGVVAVGFANVPVGADEPGAILPGQAYHITFRAQKGQKLSLAFMFGQSNDIFFAPGGEGIDLFDASGEPLRGDLTSRLILWDAGTEMNQEPGLGPDQAPRQKAPNTGAAEDGVVRPLAEVKDGFRYPKVGEVVRVTLTPATGDAMGAM